MTEASWTKGFHMVTKLDNQDLLNSVILECGPVLSMMVGKDPKLLKGSTLYSVVPSDPQVMNQFSHYSTVFYNTFDIFSGASYVRNKSMGVWKGYREGKIFGAVMESFIFLKENGLPDFSFSYISSIEEIDTFQAITRLSNPKLETQKVEDNSIYETDSFKEEHNRK